MSPGVEPRARDAAGSERLREVRGARQHAGDPPRRWFSCADADLYLWFEEGECIAFEFCYGKSVAERSFRWHRDGGRAHARIDNGEGSPLANRTPIAVEVEAATEAFDALSVALEFERVAAELEPRLYRLILDALHG